jgi:hypothetical protein
MQEGRFAGAIVPFVIFGNQIYHMSFDKSLSFGLSVFWSVLSLVGYFLLKWKLSETILFINLGFISFFLNYFLLFSWLSFREYFIIGLRKRGPEDSFVLFRFLAGIVQYCSSQFLLACAFLLLSSISIVFIGLFFALSEKVNVLHADLPGVSISFIWLTLAGLVFAAVEFIRFYRLYNAARTDRSKVFDWDALKIFHVNHRKKLNMYYFGSIVAVVADAVVSDEFQNNGGTVSLFWLFALNSYWAYTDLRFPVGTIAPVSEHLEEFTHGDK